MVSKTSMILKSMKPQAQKLTPIATEMFLPNHSGDHSAGKVLTTPTNATDIANKDYVDDSITALSIGSYAKLDGTNQPFTGNLEISKSIPLLTFTDTTSSNFAKITKKAVNDEFLITSQVTVLDGSVDQIPDMTSNTAPSGTASASTELSASWAAWKAMDDETGSTAWAAVNSAMPQWLQYAFTTPTYIEGYSLLERTGFHLTQMAKSWVIYGSNTGAFAGEETTLDTQTNQVFSGGVKNVYAFATPPTLQYYRIIVSATQDGVSQLSIGEFELATTTTSLATNNIISSISGGGIAGKGFTTFGGSLPGTILNGKTLSFAIGGTNKWVIDASGNLEAQADSLNLALGTAQDMTITFNGSGGVIRSDVVTSTDYLQLRGGTNGIDFNIGATEQISLIDGVLQPTTTNDIDLGTSSLLFKNAFFEGNITIDSDSGYLILGEGQDGKLIHNGTGFILQSDVVTATDYLQLRGGTNGIDFNIGATEQVTLTDGKLAPTTDSDIDLGDDTHYFKDTYTDAIITTAVKDGVGTSVLDLVNFKISNSSGVNIDFGNYKLISPGLSDVLVWSVEGIKLPLGILDASNNLSVNSHSRILSGHWSTTAPVTLTGYTVGSLPAGTQGDTAFVTDATAPTYLGALTGGGAVVCPVFYNGTAWVSC